MNLHPHMHRFSSEVMTTSFEAVIIHEDAHYAKTAAAAVFREVSRLELLLSRHNPGTDLSQVNRLGPGQWMAVNLEVVECLEIAARAYHETAGAFDVAFRSTEGGTRPSAMNALLLSRPDKDEPDMPSDYLVGVDPEPDTDNGSAEQGESSGIFNGLDIDLGGIGKGYALDKAQTILDDWDIDNVLLSSGTSTVLARGPGPSGDGWPVGVSGDWSDVTGLSITHLVNCALSGSGTAVKGSHIRVPATGDAAPAIAAWTKSRSAAWTDAISTALMVMPEAAARPLCAQNSDIAAVVLYPDGSGACVLLEGDW